LKKLKKLLEETEKLEKEKSEKLDKTLKHLEDMEAKSVELSAKSDKLNSDMQSVNSHLSEPISVSSSKEVYELQTETDEHHKNHTDNRIKELEEITKLEKSIIEAGGDPTQYSNISAGGLKKKYDEIHGKMNQKKEALTKEHEKQLKHEKLLQDFNKSANEYAIWSDKTLKQLMAEDHEKPEELLKNIKKIAVEALKKSGEDINALSKLSELIDEADISERTDRTFNDLQNIHEIIEDTFQKRSSNVEEAILAEKLSSVSKEQLQDFLDTFKHFDKSKSGQLDKNSFKAACAAAGEDIPDKDLDSTFAKFDEDKDGFIKFEEFITFMSSVVKEGTSYEDIVESFKEIAGGKEFITEAQIRSNMDAEEADFLVKTMPKNKDGFDYVAYCKKTYGK